MGRRPGEPPFLQGKVGYRIAPSSDPASPAHLPPKGKALGREEPSVADFRPSQGPEQNPICFLHGHAPGKKLCSPRECQLRWRGSGCIPQFWEPSAAGPKIPAFPSPPSRWAGRYGRKIQGRRPGKKEGGPPQGPPNQKRWVQGGRTSSSLVFFPPAFFQRKPGSPAGVGGGNHVAGPTLRRSRRPQTWPPPGRRPTGRCAPRPVKAPPTWRVPIISPVAFLSRAPQKTARPPPAGRPPGQSTPRPPRLGGSSRPSPARGRRR